MFLWGGISVKTDKLLISSSMLTALSSQPGIDTLKLLEPFVLVCLSDEVEPGEIVPKEKIIACLQERYAFQSMPTAVLDKILIRIAGSNEKFVKIQNTPNEGKQFILQKRPTERTNQFNIDEERAKADTQTVIASLEAWISDSTIIRKPSKEKIQEYLGNFFETNGFDVLFEIEALRSATAGNTDEVNYQIGRFILDAQENNPDLFTKILAIAQGMMLASAIYVDTTVPKIVAQRRLSDVEVFLDTTFLLYTLGFKTSDQKNSANALLDLLKNNGAKIYVFQQHFTEITEILSNFMRQDPYSHKMNQPLEGLENLEPLEIDSKIRNLEKNLNSIGIELAPTTQYTDNDGNLINGASAHIDYEGMRQHLIKRIPQYGKHPAMLDNDVNAITAVMVKRAGVNYDVIESCPAIFVTTNYSLVREANVFLGYQADSRFVTPIISDSDITTILWIKYGMQIRKDIPKLRLIEHARATLMPTSSMMNRFNNVTKRMIKNGKLSQDEAANMRYSAYAQAEIVRLCGGNSKYLSERTVLTIRDKLKSQYAEQEIERAEEAVRNEREADKRASQSEEHAKEEEKKRINLEEKAKAKRNELYSCAESTACRIATKWSKTAGIVANLIIFCFIFTVVFVISLNAIPASQNAMGFFYALITIVSSVLSFLPIRKISPWLEKRLYHWIFDFQYSKEVKKIQPQIQALKSVFDSKE